MAFVCNTTKKIFCAIIAYKSDHVVFFRRGTQGKYFSISTCQLLKF